jgi:toxin ParE1/3/4
VKPAHLRPQAEADLVEAARHDAEEGSIELAERMFDAAPCRTRTDRAHAGDGVTKSRPTGLDPRPALLARDGIPIQWLFFEANQHLDVVRLVGDGQDIIGLLSADE